MAPVQRIRCVWQNFPGAPGYTNFYVTSGLSSVAPFVTFFDALKLFIPAGTTVTVPGGGDIVVLETGELGGVWTAPGGGSVTGTGAGAMAGPAGLVCEWLTTGIVAGRRVAGKSFIVPIVTTSYEANGTLTASAVSNSTAAAAALVTATSPNFVVWARPFPGKPASGTKPAKPARSGSIHPVVTSRVPDMVAVLRSRRT